MKIKERLDKLLPELGLVETRNKAQALIMAGKVRVNGQVVTKSGSMFERNANITLDEVSQWAGRGAKKLLRAFEVFDIDINGKIQIDPVLVNISSVQIFILIQHIIPQPYGYFS